MFNFWLAFKSIFRTNNEGQKIFYPNGNRGDGYIVPTEKMYKSIQRDFIVYIIFALIVAIFGILLITVFNFNYLVAILITLVIIITVYYVWAWAETRDLEKVIKG